MFLFLILFYWLLWWKKTFQRRLWAVIWIKSEFQHLCNFHFFPTRLQLCRFISPLICWAGDDIFWWQQNQFLDVEKQKMSLSWPQFTRWASEKHQYLQNSCAVVCLCVCFWLAPSLFCKCVYFFILTRSVETKTLSFRELVKCIYWIGTSNWIASGSTLFGN